jgi:hypothetical protein
MDDLERNYEIARKIFPHKEEINFELLFTFKSEEESQNYFSHVYHPEHAGSMVRTHVVSQQYICGFNAPFRFELGHLKSIMKCYCDIASEYGGQLYKLRFHGKA